MSRDGDARRAMDALIAMSLRFYWSNPDPERPALPGRRRPDRPGRPTIPAWSRTVSLIAPIERGALVLERMSALRARFDLSPAELHLLGLGRRRHRRAGSVRQFYAASVAGVRAQGRIGMLARLLASQAFTAACLGDTRTAVPAAAEAAALAAETGQPAWTLTAR